MGSRKKVNPDLTSDILGIPPYTWQTLIQRNDKILNILKSLQYFNDNVPCFVAFMMVFRGSRNFKTLVFLASSVTLLVNSSSMTFWIQTALL